MSAQNPVCGLLSWRHQSQYIMSAMYLLNTDTTIWQFHADLSDTNSETNSENVEDHERIYDFFSKTVQQLKEQSVIWVVEKEFLATKQEAWEHGVLVRHI